MGDLETFASHQGPPCKMRSEQQNLGKGHAHATMASNLLKHPYPGTPHCRRGQARTGGTPGYGSRQGPEAVVQAIGMIRRGLG